MFSLNKNMFYPGATYLIGNGEVQLTGVLLTVDDFFLEFGVFIEGQINKVSVSVNTIIDNNIKMEKIADVKSVSKNDLEMLFDLEHSPEMEEVVRQENDNTFRQEGVDVEDDLYAAPDLSDEADIDNGTIDEFYDKFDLVDILG